MFRTDIELRTCDLVLELRTCDLVPTDLCIDLLLPNQLIFIVCVFFLDIWWSFILWDFKVQHI